MSARTQKKAMAAWARQARQISTNAARALPLIIVQGRNAGFQAYDLGIVLNDGETAWQRAPASYRYRGEWNWMVQRNSYRGDRSIINEVRQLYMFDLGTLTGSSPTNGARPGNRTQQFCRSTGPRSKPRR